MTPKRIQLSRKRGWRLPPNTVVVSRPSRWGNPHAIGYCVLCDTIHTKDEAIQKHAQEVMANLPFLNSILAPLKGKNLACWCKEGTSCHADILLKIANGSK